MPEDKNVEVQITGRVIGVPPDLPSIRTPNDTGANAFIEVVMHQCKQCGNSGPWTMTIRNESRRATQHDAWDMEHGKATGHTRFFQFKLTRANAHIM